VNEAVERTCPAGGRQGRAAGGGVELNSMRFDEPQEQRASLSLWDAVVMLQRMVRLGDHEVRHQHRFARLRRALQPATRSPCVRLRDAINKRTTTEVSRPSVTRPPARDAPFHIRPAMALPL